MKRLATAKCFVFSATGRFVADKIRISTAQTGRTYGFMAVDTDFIVGSFFYGIKIVIVHPLSVMMFATRDDISYITALHCIITVVDHKPVSFVHVAFVVADGRRSLMVHHQFNTFTLGICIQHLHIEIGVRSHKVKNIVFGVSEPVFPTFVPTFYQNLVKAVGSGKIYVSLHVLIVGAMTSVRFCFGIVRFAQLNRRQVIRIRPSAFTGNHFPPYSYIFHRFNPRNIFISARFVQI